MAALNARELASLEGGAEGATPDGNASSPESVQEEPVRCGSVSYRTGGVS